MKKFLSWIVFFFVAIIVNTFFETIVRGYNRISLLAFVFIGLSIYIYFSYFAFKYVKKEREFISENFSEANPYRFFFNGGKLGKSTTAPTVLMLFLVLSLTLGSTYIRQLFNQWNLKTVSSGTYTYYVELQKKDSKKIYTLPAGICVSSGDDGNEFVLDSAYFSNGNGLHFDYDDELILGEKVTVTDSEERNEWECKLLNKKAYSPYIEETNHLTWPNFIRYILAVLYVVILWYQYILQVKNNNTTQE